MKWLIKTLCVLWFVPSLSIAQDSSSVFTQEHLLWFVEKYHPMSEQGRLLLNSGESTVRSARGGFDPYLKGSLDQKYFDDKTYYSILNGGIVVPTWYGVEVKTGIDQNRGVFLNPENNVPSGGLWFAGISVPLGQGLFFDERRATLKQAKLFAQSTIAEQQVLMNDLYFDAIKQYWKWAKTYNKLQVYEDAVRLATQRFIGIKESFTFGDKPAIDTLEAFIQVQNRQLERNQLQLEYQQETLKLSNFLWFENNTPLELTDKMLPPAFEDSTLLAASPIDSLQTLLLGIAAQHPEMQLYSFKLESMQLDQRLKIEKLKPKLNLNYNALNEQINPEAIRTHSLNDYKWGVDFSFPIFLRKARGDLQLTQIKIENTQLKQQQKLLSIENKIRSYFLEQVNLQEQIVLYTNTVTNYSQLLEGERQKFDAGESALFLVNSRERNYIKAKLTLIELQGDRQVAQTGVIWATGNLFIRPTSE